MAEPLTPGQARFASTFASETGLDPRVVGAWLKAEQSGSAAENYERRGYHNWLNIANTDTGPAGGAHSAEWRNPESAARASAEWIKGRGRIASEYGSPSSGIRGILHAAGRNPEEQIRAIAGSGWASSGYDGGNTLRQLYGELSGHQLSLLSAASRAAGMRSGAAPVVPEREGTGRPRVNPYDAIIALHHPEGEGEGDPIQKNWELMSSLFEDKNPIHHPVGAGPEAMNTNLAGMIHEGPTKLGGFLPGNAELVMGRQDQGQDGKTNPGGPIKAPGDGVIVKVLTNPGGFGENYPVVRFTSGPLAGREVYIGHTHSVLKEGQSFKAGQRLSVTGHGTEREGNARTPGWFEIGLWPPGSMTAGSQIGPLIGGRNAP